MTRKLALRFCILLLAGVLPLTAQSDWPAVGHDPGAARYSPLKQITPGNASQLGVAWVYDTGLVDRNFETTPLVIGSVMYLTTPTETVVALAADSGRVLWTFDPKEPRVRVSRGLSYWPGDAEHAARLVMATSGDGRLIELDPQTGELIPSFGDHGSVSVPATLPAKFQHGNYGFTSPPAVYKNLLIVAPDLQEGPSQGPPGTVSAFDAISGKLVWRFHLTAQPGQPGSDTWGPNGTSGRSGPAAWAPIALDPDDGTVFVVTANPADSYYGADRPGDNLYSVSAVAIHAATGKLRWYYQLVHHDLTDTDGVGITLVNAGPKHVPAIAAVSKSALMFLLDRRTGKPIFGVTERPVAQSDVPGEHSPATQPYPNLPPPLAIQSATIQDVSTVTPTSQSFCGQLFKKWEIHGSYQPFLLEPTLHFPSTVGGANWGGMSYSPQLGYIYINTSNLGSLGQMVKAGAGGAAAPRFRGPGNGDFRGRGAGGRAAARGGRGPGRATDREVMAYHNPDVGVRFVDQDGYPCQQPPWGQLIAVNAQTGQIAWQTRLGEYPELTAKGVPSTGTPTIGGSVVTASGILFIGATPDGQFRALDASSGKPIWQSALGGYGISTPITYMGLNGKQYVAIAVGGPGSLGGVHHEDGVAGGDAPDRLVVFALGEHGSSAPQSAAPVRKQPTQTAAKPPSAASDANTAALIEKTCTQCHALTTVSTAHFTHAGWAAEVDQMIGRGALLSPSDVDTVVDYLARHYGPGKPPTHEQP
ncbi:MAG TPA: PQQ-binding-like beta-propeller repeat protein [Terriglobales bacterium]|jgi:quinoprotein glucose dehydrogenase